MSAVPLAGDAEAARFADSLLNDAAIPGGDLEVAVCRMVRQDPFATLGEIKAELKARLPERKVSRWRIFKILKRKKLLSKRSRFRYAWGRS